MFEHIKAFSGTQRKQEPLSGTMGPTGDHDDRVVPAQFKFAAELQENKKEITQH
jgi:prolyl oligopeptidase PreP (S9A serine peptidase family)